MSGVSCFHYWLGIHSQHVYGDILASVGVKYRAVLTSPRCRFASANPGANGSSVLTVLGVEVINLINGNQSISGSGRAPTG